MAYIGLQPQQRLVATSTQTLSGNGVDIEFALDRAVSKAADILVFVGNVVQVPETDYTASNGTLLFSGTNIPAAGTNNISVNYKAGALTTINISANAFPIGSTTAPSVRSVDSPATGIFWPTTTSLGFTVSGNSRVVITDQPIASSTSTGAVRIAGGLGVTGKTYIGGVTTVVDSTQSTNSATGALVVSGGLGVSKDTFIAGRLEVAGDFTVAGQFTTTGSDSLAVNDPFIFVANANPGDSLDTGIVSSYFDGTDTRYTGLFRDITDGKYKLFDRLLPQPTTTVDTGNVSFKNADLEVGNLTATNIFGTISSGNTITVLGNLSSLSVGGTTTLYNVLYQNATTPSTSTATGALQIKGGVGIVGNTHVGGNIHAPYFNGNLVGTNIVGTTLSGTSVVATNLTGNLTGTIQTAAQPSITSVGTLTGLTVGGFAQIAYGTAQYVGMSIRNNYGNATAQSVSFIDFPNENGVATGHFFNVHETDGSTTTLIGGTPAGARNSDRRVELLRITGAGVLTVGQRNATVAIANGGTAGVGNIGASGQGFNTAFVKATSAQYADVAENYLGDIFYEPGTVLSFGGTLEVTQSNTDHDAKVAGVVSTNPAYIMNDSLEGSYITTVALLGRVPTKVTGIIKKGDMLVSAGNGHARAETNPKPGSIIGKSLEDFEGSSGKIEVVVGRN